MKFEQLFKNDIHRDIETVIRAEDLRNVSTEVAEYVITKDIQKEIDKLFTLYNDENSKNGVWISGFFGSGKSHLLKILSFVLENRECDGYRIGELFADKIEDSDLLKANILKASGLHAESILFNIDNQSDTEAKNSPDPIISIFYKVFYNHLGFLGRTRHVAEFEYRLYKNGEYEDFKRNFKEEMGKEWKECRPEYHDPDVNDRIAAAMGKIRGRDAVDFIDFIDGVEKDFNISIEHFSEMVLKYLDQKGINARLNFFIDEVGQYISDNVKLMLNLQTIAESLGKATKNRVWIMVTAQEDLEATVGDKHQINSDDFSKILARFHVKIPLTNANVNEVVGIRLLKKTEKANGFLEDFWKKHHSGMQTLLSFSSTGIQFKWYESAENFKEFYPLAHYQLDLFKHCLMTLNDHNAFQGRSQSIGERSMLSVFQEVLKLMAKEFPQVKGHLTPYDLLFDGLRDNFRGTILSQILLAERQIEDVLTIRVLKVLLMVKYYKQFKADLQNISVLLVDNVHVNFDDHRNAVKKSLDLLEQQVYLSRNGDFYEFLTDKEKDIQQEIKNTRIEDGHTRQILGQMLFEDVIQDNKIHIKDPGHSFFFTKKIDDMTLNRDCEMSIVVISPLSPHFENKDYYSMQTLANSEVLMVRLNMEAGEMEDLELYLKTQKFINQTRGQGVDAETTNILNFLEKQNSERKSQMVQKLSRALGHSEYYCGGTRLEINSSNDGRGKILTGSQSLIKNAYPSLTQISSIGLTEESLIKTMGQEKVDLFSDENSGMTEAEKSVASFLKLRLGEDNPPTLSDLKSKFTSRPYGWPEMGLWNVLALIYKRGLIEIRESNNYIDRKPFTEGMLNSRRHDVIKIYLQERIPDQKITLIKEFYRELFNTGCSYNSPKDIAVDFHEQLEKLIGDVREMIGKKSKFPFLEKTEGFLEQLKAVKQRDRNALFEVGQSEIDEILDFKEDHWDKIRAFLKGSQREIFEKAADLLARDTTNLNYVDKEKMDQLKDCLWSESPYLGTTMRDAKELYESIREEVRKLLENEKRETQQVLDEEIERLGSNQTFAQLEEGIRTRLMAQLYTFNGKIENGRYIMVLREMKENIRETSLNLVNEAGQILHRKKQEDGKAAEPVVHYISKTAVIVHTDFREIKTEEDVSQYVEAMKAELLRLIKDNKVIRL